MPLQQISTPPSATAEVQVNENFETMSHMSVYGKRQSVTSGLTWGYYGGLWGGITVADGTVTLTNAATNYLVVARGTGAVSVSTAATNWNDGSGYARLYRLTTAGSVVTAAEDHRAGPVGGQRRRADAAAGRARGHRHRHHGHHQHRGHRPQWARGDADIRRHSDRDRWLEPETGQQLHDNGR